MKILITIFKLNQITKMKHLTLFFFLLISNIYSFGQYSNCYYWLSSNASLANQQQKYDESALLYEQAFEEVEKALEYDYLSAAHANAKVGNKEKTLEYLKEAATAGVEWEAIEYYEKGFFEVFGEEEYEQISVDFKDWRKEFCRGLNLSVYTQLVQMDATDQYIRRYVFKKSDSITHQYEKAVDSINTHKLKQLIEKEGFPNRREVGYDGMYNAIIIILHTGQKNKAEWGYFEPILKAEIPKGNIRPIDYATIVDAWHLPFSDKSLYGITLSGRKKLKEIENIEEVDSRRLEIGLLPLKYHLEQRGIEEIPEGYEWGGDDYLKECQ